MAIKPIHVQMSVLSLVLILKKQNTLSDFKPE